MFFGIFSSILPYVIAAGFYLVYMLFSFAQPVLQKAFSKDKVAEEKTISIKEISSEINEEKIYDFEEHSDNESFISQHNSEYAFYLPECPEQATPPILCLNSSQFSFSLFSRPPPAC